MTAPGQPWSHKNHGERILFGGIYPTVMSANGDLSNYPLSTISPWQLIKQRKIYKSVGDPVIKDDFYAGGYHDNHSGSRDIGGNWHNGKNLAISWTETTLYKTGKFCDNYFKPQFYTIEAACMTSATDIAVIFVKQELTPTFRYHRLLVKYSSNPASDTDEKFFLSINGSLDLGYEAFTSQHVRKHTGFDASGRHTASLVSDTQEVLLRTFLAGYASFSDASLGSGHTPWNVSIATDTTVTTGSGSTWTETFLMTSVFTSGDPLFDRIDMLHDSIGLIGTQITNHSLTATGERHWADEDNGSYYNRTEDESVTGRIVIRELSFTGITINTRNLPSVTNSKSKSVGFNMTGDRVASYSENSADSTNINAQLLFNQAVSILAYYHWNTAYAASATSVNDGGGGFSVTGSGTESVAEPLKVYINDALALDHEYTSSTSGAIPSSKFQTFYTGLSSGVPSEVHTSINKVALGFGTFTAHGALGSKIGLMHFDLNDTSFYDTASYSLLVNLANPTDYLVTAEPLKPAGASFTSQVGVTTL